MQLPLQLLGAAAGFALCWQLLGQMLMLVQQPCADVQVYSTVEQVPGLPSAPFVTSTSAMCRGVNGHKQMGADGAGLFARGAPTTLCHSSMRPELDPMQQGWLCLSLPFNEARQKDQVSVLVQFLRVTVALLDP
jgi:hypothetical protein